MAKNLAEIEQAMLALNRRDIAALVHRGLQALDETDSDVSQTEVEEAWCKELSKRIGDVENGRVDPVPAAHVFDRVRSSLAARRR